ncbi:MAG: hypothetical protein ACXWP5_05455, partial [Bdellovibrionota bacterium]
LSHERDVIGNDFDAWNGVIVDLRKQVVVLEPAANGDLRPVPFQEKRLPDLKYPSWLRPSTGSGKAAFVGGR